MCPVCGIGQLKKKKKKVKEYADCIILIRNLDLDLEKKSLSFKRSFGARKMGPYSLLSLLTLTCVIF